MSKRFILAGLIALSVVVIIGVAAAIDSPHTGNCNACHMIHNSLGPSLTNQATNELLCMSCHKIGGAASSKPFSTSDQAVPGTSGTSHAWTTSMDPGVAPLNLVAGSPNNKYGLRTAAEVTNAGLQTRLQSFGNKVSCSVCHNQHLEAALTWNPYAYGPKGDYGTATSAGTTTIINDANKGASWTANGWVGYYVKITTGASANIGQVREIGSNTATQLTVTAAFPAAIGIADRYEIIGRGFQRADNNLNQLCEDCHYYRTPASLPAAGAQQTNVRVWDGNAKSHPVGKVFTAALKDVADAAQYNAVPLEPNWAQQAGARYHMNGGADANHTNNLVVGPDNQIRCLTCHGMHYTDSNTATIDQP